MYFLQRIYTIIAITTINFFIMTSVFSAGVLLQDGMEGHCINELVTYNLDDSATYTVDTANASPFTSPVFGSSSSCGYLNDQSTLVSPLLSATVSGVGVNDWVHVEFDLSPVSGNYDQWQYCIGESTAWPYSFEMRINRSNNTFVTYGRYNSADAKSFIPIPNITVQAGDWYHFDILIRPSDYDADQRIMNVTVTRDSSGTRTSGSLTGIIQEDSGPVQRLWFAKITNNNHSYTGSIRMDNVLMEKLTPLTEMSDGVEGTTVNPLQSYDTAVDATYTTDSTDESPFLSEPLFTTASTQCGLLDDQSTTLTPYLSQTGITDNGLRYAFLQFDFNLVSDDFDQWQYFIGEDNQSPYAFDLRVSDSNLEIYGRYSTSDSLQLISIPNVTAVEGDWYHVDVVMKPVALAANKRSYDITVTQNSSGTISKGTLCGILQEDDETLDVFSIKHITDGVHTRTGSIKIDNVLLQTLGFGDDDGLEDVDFRYAYLPSYNKLRYHLTGSWPTAISQWQVQLIRDSDSVVMAQDSDDLPFSLVGETLSIPALSNGDYTVKLTLTGGTVSYDIERHFTHTDPAWKNSTLGNDDVLVPPFTALEVDGNDVSCILRNHTMSSAGLWSQVESQNTDILDAAITFKIVANSQTYTASGSGLSFDTTSNTKVTGSATWSAGPITDAGVDFEYDYDGLMKVTLNLPTTTSQVDELYLEIPLKESEASYMQAMTDYLRINPAATIPAGSGEVWNSSEVSRHELPEPFVPYIWLGGPERGICWLAENDKDCLLDADTPTMSISRSSGRLTLKVWFITTPKILSRSRSIKFALMATPAKPMADSPKSWRQWQPFNTDSQSNDFNFDFMGSCYYWGSQTACLQFYPAFHNYEIYDEFLKARQSGISNEDFIDDWTDQFTDSIYAPFDEETYRPHVNWSFHKFSGDWSLGGQVRAEVAKDGLEGTTINPFTTANTDQNATWTSSGTNPSPFDNDIFGTSTLSGLLNDQSTAVTPYIQSSGFGLSSSDSIWAQFDINPVSGNYDQWGICFGDTATWKYAAEIRFWQGGFAVYGRRGLSDSGSYITVPNITVTAGNWYHIDLILSPSETTAANRTYTLTITEDDGNGNRTYGTLRGILQEDSNPVNLFRIWHYWNGDNTLSGAIEIDNFSIRTVKPMVIAPYTNPRGIVWDDEAMTYMDEWSIYDVADPRWEDAVANGSRLLRENADSYDALTGKAYFCDPISSYQNMAMYYQKKMYDRFSDGIYWDDFYMLANYNPVSGPAYVNDDGRLCPGINIYAFRELARRNAIMQHQMNMRPFAWMHMTSIQLVPVLSFGQVNYDWEWYGFGSGANQDMDAQDRYELDDDPAYMLATTAGFQSGNLGVMLDLFTPSDNDPDKREWLLRTALAVALPHEVKIKSPHSMVKDTMGLLCTFGYGMSDSTVYRYWDSVYPINCGGTAQNVKALVIKRPDKAYVVLGSYGNGGDCDFTLDLSELGLSSTVNATDDETSTSLTKLGTGQFRINIDKHDFKLIKIE